MFIVSVRPACKELHLSCLLQEPVFTSAFYFPIALLLLLVQSLKLCHYPSCKGASCFLILKLLVRMKPVYKSHQC